jgi:hypothetical protein
MTGVLDVMTFGRSSLFEYWFPDAISKKCRMFHIPAAAPPSRLSRFLLRATHSQSSLSPSLVPPATPSH